MPEPFTIPQIKPKKQAVPPETVSPSYDLFGWVDDIANFEKPSLNGEYEPPQQPEVFTEGHIVRMSDGREEIVVDTGEEIDVSGIPHYLAEKDTGEQYYIPASDVPQDSLTAVDDPVMDTVRAITEANQMRAERDSVILESSDPEKTLTELRQVESKVKNESPEVQKFVLDRHRAQYRQPTPFEQAGDIPPGRDFTGQGFAEATRPGHLPEYPEGENVKQFFNEAFAQPYYSMMSGVQGGTSRFFTMLDNYARYLEDKTGLEGRGGLFEDLAKLYNDNAEYYDSKGIDPKEGFMNSLADALYTGSGQLIVDLPQIIALRKWGLPIFMGAHGGSEAIAENEQYSELMASLQGGETQFRYLNENEYIKPEGIKPVIEAINRGDQDQQAQGYPLLKQTIDKYKTTEKPDEHSIALGIAKGVGKGIVLHNILSGLKYAPQYIAKTTAATVFGGMSLQEELKKPAVERDMANIVAGTLMGAFFGKGQKGKTHKQFFSEISDGLGLNKITELQLTKSEIVALRKVFNAPEEATLSDIEFIQGITKNGNKSFLFNEVFRGEGRIPVTLSNKIKAVMNRVLGRPVTEGLEISELPVKEKLEGRTVKYEPPIAVQKPTQIEGEVKPDIVEVPVEMLKNIVKERPPGEPTIIEAIGSKDVVYIGKTKAIDGKEADVYLYENKNMLANWRFMVIGKNYASEVGWAVGLEILNEKLPTVDVFEDLIRLDRRFAKPPEPPVEVPELPAKEEYVNEEELLDMLDDKEGYLADTKEEYVYDLRARPTSIGTEPMEGLIRKETQVGFRKHGRLYYDRPLTEEERLNYELIPVKYELIPVKAEIVPESKPSTPKEIPPAEPTGTSIPVSEMSADDIIKELDTATGSRKDQLQKRIDEIEDYKEYQEGKLDRLKDRAAASRKKSEAAFDKSRDATSMIPYGQPIMVGHHSEGKHRAALKRSETSMRKGMEEGEKADYYEGRVESAESNRAISAGDPEAIAKLNDKIANRQKGQETMKSANKIIKNKSLADEEKIIRLVNMGISEGKAKELLKPDYSGRAGYPSYELTNNNANIRRMKQRVERLKKEAVREKPDIKDLEFEIKKTVHTKKGHDVWVVTMPDRVSRPDYQILRARAKENGGYYSRYSRDGAIPGFQFKSEEDAQAFIKNDGAVVKKTVVAPDTKPRPLTVNNLRKVADRMQKRIDDLLAPRQDNTARRARMAEGASEEGYRLKTIQGTLRNLADAIEKGELKYLDKVNTKTDVEHLIRLERMTQEPYSRPLKYEGLVVNKSNLNDVIQSAKGVRGAAKARDSVMSYRAVVNESYVRITGAADDLEILLRAIKKAGKDTYPHTNVKENLMDYKRLKKLGITNQQSLENAIDELRLYIGGKISAAEKQKLEIKTKERELAGVKMRGFFPTPKTVINQMIEEADIQKGDRVLEPSAGKGDIADLIKEKGITPDVVEISQTLRDILRTKGYELVGSDFTDPSGMDNYDKILMNPPFENGQDMDHVQIAYDLLVPGGKLVAIMSESSFFRSEKKYVEFREWLESVGGSSEKLPEGAFKGIEAFRQTGVNARMVVIEKAAETISKGKGVTEDEFKSKMQSIIKEKLSALDESSETDREFNRALKNRNQEKEKIKSVGKYLLDRSVEKRITEHGFDYESDYSMGYSIVAGKIRDRIQHLIIDVSHGWKGNDYEIKDAIRILSQPIHQYYRKWESDGEKQGAETALADAKKDLLPILEGELIRQSKKPDITVKKATGNKVTLHPPVKGTIDTKRLTDALVELISGKQKKGKASLESALDEFGLVEDPSYSVFKWDRSKKPDAATQPMSPNFLDVIPEKDRSNKTIKYEPNKKRIIDHLKNTEPKISVTKFGVRVTWKGKESVPIGEDLLKEHNKDGDPEFTINVKSVKPQIVMFFLGIPRLPKAGVHTTVLSSYYNMLLNIQKQLSKKGIDPEYVETPIWTVMSGRQNIKTPRQPDAKLEQWLSWKYDTREYTIGLDDEIAEQIKAVTGKDDITGVKVEMSKDFFGKEVSTAHGINIMGIELGFMGFTPQSMRLLYDGLVSVGKFTFNDLPGKLRLEARRHGINKDNFTEQFGNFKNASAKAQAWFKKVWEAIKAWYAKNREYLQQGAINPKPIGFINTMAERYNQAGRPNKLQFIKELKESGFTKQEIKRASQLYTQIKEKSLVEPGVVTPIEKELSKLEDKEQEAVDLIKAAGYQTTEQFKAREVRDDIRQRITTLIRGHRIGSKEKNLELMKLKMMIRNYAKDHLPKYEITKGQIKPILTALSKVKNERQLNAVFNRIDEIAKKVHTKQLLRGINKELKRTKMKKVSGKLTGKMTADTQETIEQVRQIVKMSLTEAETETTAMYEIAVHQNTEPSEKDAQRIYLLELYGGLKTKSVDQLADALLNLQSIINDGVTLRSIKEQVRRTKNDIMQRKAAEIITGGKPVHGKLLRRTQGLDDTKMTRIIWNIMRGSNATMQSWETLLDIYSFHDKGSAPYNSFLNIKFGGDLREADLSEQEGVRLKEIILTESAESIFGAKGRKLEKILNKNETPEEVDVEILVDVLPERLIQYGKTTKLKVSQNELAQYWMWLQDTKLEETFKNMGFTKKTRFQIKVALDPKVRGFAEYLLNEFYPAYYPEINSIYKNMFHVNLSYNPKYSHLSREFYGKDTDQGETLDSTSPLASAYSGHLIARVDSKRPLQPTDMLKNAYQHIFQMEHFISHAQPIRELRAVFNDAEVRGGMEEYFGVKMLQVFDRFVEDIARGGISRDKVSKSVDLPIRNFIRAKIGLKPVIFLKQLASIPANMAEMPVHQFIKGMGGFFINPRKAIRTLKDSRLVKSRGKGFNRDVRSLLVRSTTKRLSNTKGFNDWLMSLAKLGDIGAIISGGWSVYDYHYKIQIKAGESHDAAHLYAIGKFDATAEKWQQSGQVKNLSQLQRSGSVMKMFTMFLNSLIQYFQQGETGIRNLIAGRGKKSENIKRTLVAYVVLQAAFQIIAQGLSFDPDDEDFWKELSISWAKGIPILGSALKWLVFRRFMYTITPIESVIPELGRAWDAGGKIVQAVGGKEEYTQKELVKMADDVMNVIGTVTGTPYQGVSGIVKGVYETVTGEADKPIRRSLGYSNYALYGTNEEKRLILIKAVEHNKSQEEFIEDLSLYYKGEGKSAAYIKLAKKKAIKDYKIYSRYGLDNDKVNELMKGGQTNDDKAKYLKRLKGEMPAAEFKKFYNEAKKLKVISDDLHSKFTGKKKKSITRKLPSRQAYSRKAY